MFPELIHGVFINGTFYQYDNKYYDNVRVFPKNADIPETIKTIDSLLDADENFRNYFIEKSIIYIHDMQKEINEIKKQLEELKRRTLDLRGDCEC